MCNFSHLTLRQAGFHSTVLVFSRVTVWILTGASCGLLTSVCRGLSAPILAAARRAFLLALPAR